jgi:hypothetical protein
MRSGDSFPNFYQMSTRYTDCGQCDGYTEDKGWHCTGCATSPGTCNCLIGGFTIGGHTYYGKWYPGVNNPPGGTPNWPCGSPYAPPVPNDCGPS